jgi:hypothetical protein
MTTQIVPVITIQDAARLARVEHHTAARVFLGTTSNGIPLWSFCGAVIAAPGQRHNPSE